MRIIYSLLLAAISFGAVCSVKTAHACPLVSGLVDLNCDQTLKVVVVGDSIVKGIGDLKNGHRGGYVLRLQKKFKRATFVNLGKPGFSSHMLYSVLAQDLARSRSKTSKQLAGADYVIVAVGTNDFFEETEPGVTENNIERIISLLREKLSQGGVSPILTAATLTPTRRGFQRPFVESVNSLLLQFSSPVQLPLFLRFEELDLGFISTDGIHPTSNGYDQ